VSVELRRHVSGLVSDFAAEYGEIDLIGRRIDCSAETHERLSETFETFGVVGGAGIRVTEGEKVLLVSYEAADGWIDPGDSRRPGESYTECARRGVREATGIEAAITDIAQIHLLLIDDPTGRDPIPNPYVSFRGTYESGTVRPGPDVASVRWTDEPPEELLYEELAEHPLLA
jgi:ADP-ribose pyrophosphatase YjhB (NUDIX family)